MVMEYWPRGMAQRQRQSVDLLWPLGCLGFNFSSILDDGATIPISLSQLIEWGESQLRTATSRNLFLEKSA